MLELQKGFFSSIKIDPLWPQKSIFIDDLALAAAQEAQALLPTSIRLVISRGYQPEFIWLKGVRFFGGLLFRILYPNRKSEIKEIFGHNGHATDGRHIDIQIEFEGNRLNFLPYRVFTPVKKIEHLKMTYDAVLSQVTIALQKAGFKIHHNKIEALQIHCDFT